MLDALNGAGNEEGNGSDDDNDNAREEKMDEDDDDSGDGSHHTNIEDDDNRSGDNNDDASSHQSRESNDSSTAGLTARDRYNIRQVEQYIDHLENLARRREQRREGNRDLSSPARSQGVYNDSTKMYEREVARSMKHGRG